MRKYTFRPLLVLCTFLLFTLPAFGQVATGVNIPFGPTLPTSCLPSSRSRVLYYKTGSSNGLYQCLTANAWTLVGGGGGVPAGTVTSVTSANGDITVATGTTTPVLTSIGRVAPTASTPAGRDANANLSANNFLGGFATTTTAAGTTTLTVASKQYQQFTGATTQTVVLPVVSTLVTGQSFVIINKSSGALTINSSGGNLVQTAAANTTTTVNCVLVTGTTDASWNAANVGGSGISGLTTNTLPKATSATTLGDSGFSDDGTTLQVGAGDQTIQVNQTAHSIRLSTGAISSSDAINIDSGAGTTTIGDANGAGLGTTVVVNDATQQVTVNASITDISGNLVVDNNAKFNGDAILQGGPIYGDGTSITAGKVDKPFPSVFIGNSFSNQLTGTFTGNRVATFPDASGTVQLVGAAGTGAILSCLSNNTVLATATGTVYSSPGNDGTPLTVTTEGNVSFPVTRAGTIRNLYVRTGTTAKTNTPVTTITIRKNGADSSVTLVLTQTVSTTSSDTTHSFSVVAGDLITVSLSTTGTAAVSTSIASLSFELD